jgi:hypothetical protein
VELGNPREVAKTPLGTKSMIAGLLARYLFAAVVGVLI